MGAVSVISGSVQLCLKVSDKTYLVDLWSQGGDWKWAAKRAGAPKAIGQGDRPRWSEARTAAFRACVKHASES